MDCTTTELTGRATPMRIMAARRKYGIHALWGALAAMLACPVPAGAIEGGGSHYPTGVNTATPALIPPPGGTILLNYNQYYTANRYNGSNGQSAIPGFNVNVFAEAARFIHTWTEIEGLQIGSQIVPTWTYVDIRVPTGRSSRGGFADLNITPLIVSKKIADVYLAAFANFWAPTGRYDQSDPASNGLNYWTFGPEFAATWLPQGGRWELSADAITQFSLNKNPATDFRSGHLFNLDLGAGYRPFTGLPNLQLAVQGNILTQWTDDTVNGKRFAGGNRARNFSIGPQIRYDIGHGGLLFKWQHEFGVENLPSGERLWLQLAIPL